MRIHGNTNVTWVDFLDPMRGIKFRRLIVGITVDVGLTGKTVHLIGSVSKTRNCAPVETRCTVIKRMTFT